MKKLLIICLILIIIQSQVVFAKGRMGDINGDSKITETDEALIERFILHQLKLDNDQKLRADIDGDGYITSTDSAYVQGYLLGIYDSLENISE